MPSMQSRIMAAIFKQLRFNKVLGKMIEKQKWEKPTGKIPSILIKQYHVEEHVIQKGKLTILQPKEVVTDRVLLYFHGGAFLQSMKKIHWRFISRLLKRTKLPVAVLDYSLLPDSKWEDMLQEAMLSYSLLAKKEEYKEIVLFGDSAGAGLALGLVNQLSKVQRAKCHSLLLISPWLDFALNDPHIDDIAKNDFILEKTSLKTIGLMLSYPHSTDQDSFGPIKNPCQPKLPIHLFTSTHDLLSVDATNFKLQCPHAILHVYEEMLHDFIFLECQESFQAIEIMSQLMIKDEEE